MGSNALPKGSVKTKVQQAILGGTVVGYDLKHDLEALGMQGNRSAEWIDLVDIYGKKGLKESVQKQNISIHDNKSNQYRWHKMISLNILKTLAKEYLGKNIRQNTNKGHSSMEDARTTMELYQRHRSNGQ